MWQLFAIARHFEPWVTQALLRSPTWHRFVGAIHRQVRNRREGVPPEEMGGTKIDVSNENRFMKHFLDEIKLQLGVGKSPNHKKDTSISIMEDTMLRDFGKEVRQQMRKEPFDPPKS